MSPSPSATAPHRPTPAQGPRAAGDSIVVKRLAAGRPGTKRHLERFGAALVCVRYRQDAATGDRLTTVELIIDQRPAKAKANAGTVLIRIGYGETLLRKQAKAAGGKWIAARKLWQVPKTLVRRLKLAKRVVPQD